MAALRGRLRQACAADACDFLIADTPVRLLPAHQPGPPDGPVVLDTSGEGFADEATPSAGLVALPQPDPFKARPRVQRRRTPRIRIADRARRDSIREVIHVRRNTLVRCLLAHDERDLVERVPSVTDEELERIGERADWYAFSSEDAMPNDSMGTSRAISLAAVDVLEGASRELKRRDGERDPGVEERALRRLRLPFNPVKNRHLVD
jgi:hypothetical protein